MNFKKGKPYEIIFLDHSAGLMSIVQCCAVGYVIKDEKDFVLLSSWIVKTEDEKIFKSNLETIAIIKKCIKQKRLLK